MKKFYNFSKDYRAHKFTLLFENPQTEKAYRLDYNNRHIKQNRISLIVASLVLALYAILEFTVMGVTDNVLFLIKFGVILPAGLLLSALSFIEFFRKKSDIFFSSAILVGGLGLSIMILREQINYFSPSLLGLMVFYFYSFTILRVLFFRTFLLVSLLYVGYIFCIIFTGQLISTQGFSSFYFLGISFLFGLYAGYYIEYIDRYNFASIHKLRLRNAQYKELQNKLEHTVQKRTSDLKTAYQDLEKAKIKADESNQLKTNFLATISHEIRTPLTSILGFSQLIAKAKADPIKQKKYIDVLEESTEHLLQIITNILTLSEIQANQVEVQSCVINPSTMCEEIDEQATMVLMKHKKNLPFSINSQEKSIFSITIGKQELMRVISHLLDNAVKYTEKGEFGISCNINNTDLFEICIYDTGIGISENKLEFIFEYFRQEDQQDTRKYSGIGVGLSICKGLIQKAGGNIKVESERNKGTKVFVTIPILH